MLLVGSLIEERGMEMYTSPLSFLGHFLLAGNEVDDVLVVVVTVVVRLNNNAPGN